MQVPAPIEQVMIFPMAVVPSLFGLWNMLIWHRRCGAACDRTAWRDAAAADGAHRRAGGDKPEVMQFSANGLIVVSDVQHSLCVGGAGLCGGDGGVLPGLEVHRGDAEPGAGDCVRLTDSEQMIGVAEEGSMRRGKRNRRARRGGRGRPWWLESRVRGRVRCGPGGRSRAGSRRVRTDSRKDSNLKAQRLAGGDFGLGEDEAGRGPRRDCASLRDHAPDRSWPWRRSGRSSPG